MYLPDRTAPLKEMVRVLKPSGRLWRCEVGAYERATIYVSLTEIRPSRARRSIILDDLRKE